MTPENPKLYQEVKEYINGIYKKPSAYRSMAYMKEYKRRNGRFIPDRKPKNLSRWMKEEWRDVNPNKTKRSYPVFRPTKRISRKTPLTVDEIPLRVLQKQATRKQRIKGLHNLPPFETMI